MKKWFAAFLTLAVACLPLTMARMEVVYKYTQSVDYTDQLECPMASLEELIEDDLQLKAALAMRQWFVGDFLIGDDWYNKVWDHTSVILTEPYIIKTEYGTQRADDLTIYGFAVISSYGLFRGADGSLYLDEGEQFDGLFRANFLNLVGDDWRLQDVHCLLDMDEELYPGAGCGIEGYPGMTDELDTHIPREAWSTAGIAQKYLDANDIDATIVAW